MGRACSIIPCRTQAPIITLESNNKNLEFMIERMFLTAQRSGYRRALARDNQIVGRVHLFIRPCRAQNV